MHNFFVGYTQLAFPARFLSPREACQALLLLAFCHVSCFAYFFMGDSCKGNPGLQRFHPVFRLSPPLLFLSQHDQTGQQASPLDEILARAAADLHARRAQGRPPVELAFYGGTFTALAPRDLDACLDMADSLRRDGCITRFRCSTRPDRLDAALLARLRRHGCRTVELGIQSFFRYGPAGQ